MLVVGGDYLPSSSELVGGLAGAKLCFVHAVLAVRPRAFSPDTFRLDFRACRHPHERTERLNIPSLFSPQTVPRDTVAAVARITIIVNPFIPAGCFAWIVAVRDTRLLGNKSGRQ